MVQGGGGRRRREFLYCAVKRKKAFQSGKREREMMGEIERGQRQFSEDKAHEVVDGRDGRRNIFLSLSLYSEGKKNLLPF